MNLIICTSPLQVILAERIIASRPGESFYGLMFSRSVNDKTEHYYQRLRALSHEAEHLVVPYDGNRWSKYLLLPQMACKGKRLGSIQRVYISSLDIIELQFILSAHPRAEVYTFDDGLINVTPTAWEGMIKNYDGGYSRLMRKLLGAPTVEELIQRSQKHYTIYRLPNVMPRTEYLPLFEPVQEPAGQAERTVRILLGQMLYWEGDHSRNEQLAGEVVRKYDIHYYMPHPKEGYQVAGVEYLHSPLVFEDFILQALREHPTTHYEVYLYCSTPSLNLVGLHPRLSFVSIKPTDSPQMFDYTYQLISQAGIPVHTHTLAQ